MWYYLFRDSDGALLSESSDPIQARAGHTVRESADRLSQRADVAWDPITKTFAARLVPQPVPAFGWLSSISAADRARIRAAARDDAVIADFLAMLELAALEGGGRVDLADPTLAAGVQYLRDQRYLPEVTG